MGTKEPSKTAPKAGKSSKNKPISVPKIEVLRRVYIIQERLMEGYSTRETKQWAKDFTTWGLCDSQIDEYIARATADLKENYESDNRLHLAKAVGRLEALYKKNALPRKIIVKGDNGEEFEDEIQPNDKMALEVLRELHKVVGLLGGSTTVTTPPGQEVKKITVVYE